MIYQFVLLSSISLDEERCVLIYNGENDLSVTGVKPIAIQVEDFDESGNVKSSVPVQFLATVWTPQNDNFSNRFMYGPGKPAQIPDLFPIDDHNDDHADNHVHSVGRRSVPEYCNNFPTLVDPSPGNGAVMNVPAEGITFSLAASSNNGVITRFVYQRPAGLECTQVDMNGRVDCTFTPLDSQLNQGNFTIYKTLSDVYNLK